MYVFIASEYNNSDNSCICGFPDAIFKMLAMKNYKKPKLGISIIQLKFITNWQYMPLNVFFWEW